MTKRLEVVFAMDPPLRQMLFPADLLHRLSGVARFDPQLVLDRFDTQPARAALAAAEVVITGWRSPMLTAELVQSMPELRAVVHAAGSVKHHLSEDFWTTGIPVSSAAQANSLPVAEYTLAAILFANKGVLEIARRYRTERRQIDWRDAYPGIGNLAKQVGVVGMSRIGRRVMELLTPFDLDVVVADPLVSAGEAAALGGRLVELDELVETSQIVSLHAPALPETKHLIDARRLALMPPGATLINTARGSLVDTAALTEAVVAGRVKAILDITEPETLPADSPLYDHPDVLLTPHIAGSFGTELQRLGAAAVQEIERLARGEGLCHRVQHSELRITA